MRSYINRVLWQIKRKPVASTTPLTPTKPTTEHFEPILEEIQAFGTDFEHLLRPAFGAYREAKHEPLVAAEEGIMESAMRIQELSHELAAIVPDHIRAARRNHPLNITSMDDDPGSGRDRL